MGTQLYPTKDQRIQKEQNKSVRPWHVDYKLIYERGTVKLTGYYRTRIGARIAAFWYVRIISNGGSAYLRHRYEYGNAPNAQPLKLSKKNDVFKKAQT